MTGDGGQIDDRRLATLAQARHGLADAQKLTRDIDGQGAFPIGQRQGFDSAGGPGHAGIVDQHIQAAEFPVHQFEHRRDIGLARYVGDAAVYLRQSFGEALEAFGPDVANQHFRAGLRESSRDFQTNPVASGRHHHTLSGQGGLIPHRASPGCDLWLSSAEDKD